MSDTVQQPVTSHPELGALPLARTAIDRGCERRTRAGWLDGLRADPETRHLVMIGGRARVLDGELVLLEGSQVPADGTEIYLGADGSTEIVLHSFAEAPAAADGAPGTAATHPEQWLGLRDVAAGLGARDAGLFVEAVAIANWNHTMNFCPGCGGKLELRDSGWVKHCPAEGIEHFPRTDPAVIVAITDEDDRLLLGANKAWGGTRFSTLAGFVEPGESLESAVIREVAEESGVIVQNPRYMGSQPWPFPRSLMLGFTATATGTELLPDGVEIIDLRWFTREQLAAEVRSGAIAVPSGASIASALIEHWFGGVLPEPERLEN
ncbi:NAD(+) diphosphatase [Paeniglutamicibacter psychrophenolicus]|uniref:NAD(+) diphosphatase n=1 Tax=Paeniglutamicibacter psychrophenolicus TaxID=257454 RepID=A0ABS4WDB5_9MICC|nr:NAD(+) diphosphatase [Paeniglutamicibacter psychrophenolicus]MBP2374205.1 NAD+ diphosphatase [Paeniglutamicibacter psychrophenolicus]